MAELKWYVYQFFHGEDCIYVGKGSGKRFNVQKRRFEGFVGRITAYFMNEVDCLSHETTLIKTIAPAFNKAQMPKQSSPWMYSLLPQSSKDDREFYIWCNAIGTRAMAARVILSKPWSWLRQNNIDINALTSKVGGYKGVYYGSYC